MPLGLCALPAVLLLLAAGPAGETVYSWTDADGVAHYTNDLSSIPQRYRDKARTLDGQPVPSPDAADRPPAPAEAKPSTGEEASKPVAAKPPATRLEDA